MQAVSIALICVALASPLASQSVPTGFQVETVGSGFVTPVGIDRLPDGRLIVIEQVSARVRILTLSGTLGTIGQVAESTIVGGRSGLGGIAVDPRWPAAPYIYVHYTVVNAPIQRVVRYTLSGDLSDANSVALTMADPYVILDNLPDQVLDHNGSALAFAPDGTLYVSLGDDLFDCLAQEPSSLLGQILRLRVDHLPAGPGGPPTLLELEPMGNPYPASSPEQRLVWATGLRNPWRMAADSVTGALAIGDVGNVTWEEVNVAEIGGTNFQWPLFEGSQPMPISCPSAVSHGISFGPAIAIAHATQPGPKSVLVLDWYRNETGAGSAFGPAYEDTIIYADYFRGHIRRLERVGIGWRVATPVPGQPSTEDWGLGFSSVADAVRGEDGSLYLAMHGRGTVLRIRRGQLNRQLTVVGGLGQIADAGRTASQPLRVRATDLNQQPLAGIPITFADQAGGGTMTPQTAITDAAGEAEALFVPGEAPFEVTAFEPSGASTAIPMIWRGLGVAVIRNDPLLGDFLFIAVGHSATSSPITILMEAVGAAPSFSTPRGEVLGGFLQAHPGMLALDGIGLFGPADSTVVTEALAPTFDFLLQGPPVFNVSFRFQAVGFDAALGAAPESLFISNIVDLTL